MRPVDDALQRSRREVRMLGHELANARRTMGASQRSVARAIGWSGSRVGRLERGERASVSHAELAAFASVVGLRYSGRLFVGGSRLRDATQLATIASYRAMAASCGWACRIEEPMPITGDLRAFDLVLEAPGRRVAHEFVSRLRDVQGQVRPLLVKQRDAGVGCLVLVLRDTAENRRVVHEAGQPLSDVFPLGTRAVLASLRRLEEPSQNGIVFWRAPDARTAAG